MTYLLMRRNHRGGGVPGSALTIGGVPLTIGGVYLTIGS
jgi:hypothetical protein